MLQGADLYRVSYWLVILLIRRSLVRAQVGEPKNQAFSPANLVGLFAFRVSVFLTQDGFCFLIRERNFD